MLWLGKETLENGKMKANIQCYRMYSSIASIIWWVRSLTKEGTCHIFSSYIAQTSDKDDSFFCMAYVFRLSFNDFIIAHKCDTSPCKKKLGDVKTKQTKNSIREMNITIHKDL